MGVNVFVGTGEMVGGAVAGKFALTTYELVEQLVKSRIRDIEMVSTAE